MTEKLHYDFDLRLEVPSNAHGLQFALIPEHSRVLDVGCGTGIIGAELQKRKACLVDGVDFDEQALPVASTRLHRVSGANLDERDWAEHLKLEGLKGYDIVIFGDVLEHTLEPENVLREAKALLAPNGRVILSIPNVAYFTVRLRMLFGKFNYEESGILDRNHLRFFTLATARAMVSRAGYSIVSQQYASFVLPWGRPMPRWLMRMFPGLLAAGFIFEAKPV
ncbi:MAG: class I SAM-dependent methyltransferase [Bacteroidota bacterium]|nr:class I SAM-dependent methyltransferase [Bacteroidota bacterium]MDP4232667.1 class I SAM-dependent methyltransferase [Bacteroidota bacterium]MDP4243200.1 class I SAM-dependent methyltransferase [Bacteroidota bacterium]MDP4288412.1 class I SAM-dependent methyltransferase [Bacteroidota bacterium]